MDHNTWICRYNDKNKDKCIGTPCFGKDINKEEETK